MWDSWSRLAGKRVKKKFIWCDVIGQFASVVWDHILQRDVCVKSGVRMWRALTTWLVLSVKLAGVTSIRHTRTMVWHIHTHLQVCASYMCGVHLKHQNTPRFDWHTHTLMNVHTNAHRWNTLTCFPQGVETHTFCLHHKQVIVSFFSVVPASLPELALINLSNGEVSDRKYRF